MPENDDTAEEITARKLKSDIDFAKSQIASAPSGTASFVSLEDGVVEALVAEGYFSDEFGGQVYVAASAEALAENAAQRPPTE